MAATIQNVTMSGIITHDVATLGVPTAPEERFQAFLKSFERVEAKEVQTQAVRNSSQPQGVRSLQTASPQHDTMEMSSGDVGAKPSTVPGNHEAALNPGSNLAIKNVLGGAKDAGRVLHASAASNQSSLAPGMSRSSPASASDTEHAVSSDHTGRSAGTQSVQTTKVTDTGSPKSLSGSAVPDHQTTATETGNKQSVSGILSASGSSETLSSASSGVVESESAKVEPSAQSSLVESDMPPDIEIGIADVSLAAPDERIPVAPSKLETSSDGEVGSAPVVEQEDAETNASDAAQRTGLRALVLGAGAAVETHVEQDLGDGHRLVIHMGPAGESGKQSLQVHATDLGMNASLVDTLDDLRAVVQTAAVATPLTSHASEAISSNIELAVMETPMRLSRKVESSSISGEVENAGSHAELPSKSVFVSLLDVIA